jgi:hypothetical protein
MRRNSEEFGGKGKEGKSIERKGEGKAERGMIGQGLLAGTRWVRLEFAGVRRGVRWARLEFAGVRRGVRWARLEFAGGLARAGE